jgi:hypothetical protein
MRAPSVWIRNRNDGVVELSPTICPVARGDRWLVIFTVVMAAAGVFMAGAMPGAVLMLVFASAIAGEVVLGAKAVLLVLLRPAAQVVEVPRFSARAGLRGQELRER